MEKEIWKDIPGYKGFYQASNIGNIRSLNRSMKKGFRMIVNSGGTVVFSKNNIKKTITVSRLIAKIFLKKPQIHIVNGIKVLPYLKHKNGNYSDNRAENLEWKTMFFRINKAIYEYENTDKSLSDIVKEYGINDSYLKKYGRKSKKTKPSFSIKKAINEYKKNNISLTELAKKYNTTYAKLRELMLKNDINPSDALKLKKEECGRIYLEKTKKDNSKDCIISVKKELCEKFVIRKNTLNRWLEFCNIPSVAFHGNCQLEKKERDKLKQKARDLYINEKLNCHEIARLFHEIIDPATIRSYIKDVKRSASETHAIRLSKKGITSEMSLGAFNGIVKGTKGNIKTPFGKLHFDSSYEEDRIKQHLADNTVRLISRCKDWIPYTFENKNIHYVPDLYVEYENGDKIVEEIKPYIFLDRGKNPFKIEAARNFYKEKDITYRIITEKDIYNRKRK